MIYKAEMSIAEKATTYEDKRIEFSVHDDPEYGAVVLMNVAKYDEGNPITKTTNEYSFPPFLVSDLVRLLAAFGYAGTDG